MFPSNLRIFRLPLIHLEWKRCKNAYQILVKFPDVLSEFLSLIGNTLRLPFSSKVESNKDEIDVCKIRRKYSQYRTCMEKILPHTECRMLKLYVKMEITVL